MMANLIEIKNALLGLRWLAVWQRNFRVWLKIFGPSLLANFGEPLIYLLALGYGLGGFIGTLQELPYLVFLASGIVCSSAMFTASFEAMYSAYTRMQVQCTWDAMLATPIDISDIVIGEAIWAASKSLLSGSAILVVAALLGAVQSWQALLALPVIALTGLCFGALALVVTAVSKSYDFFLYYTTLVITPMLVLSGVFFPLQQMPGTVQTLTELLPLSHAVQLVRPLLTHLSSEQVVWHLLVLLFYTIIALVLAQVLIKKRLQA